MTNIQIRALRLSHNLTQTQAAKLVWVSLRGWQLWESGDRTMSQGLQELFLRKLDACPHCNHRYQGDKPC